MKAIILKDESSSSELEVARNKHGFFFEIEDIWYGSSEGGFGARLGLTISESQMRELINWVESS